MATTAEFHELHGPNIVLTNDNTEATWQLERSGGVIFSEDPLQPGDNIKVTCEGSGRVRIGCTTENPLQYKSDVPDSVSDISGFEVMNEVRFHKRQCNVHVLLNTAGDTIASSCGFLKYDKVLHRKQLVWIAVYTMFGEVRITIVKHDETKQKLSLSHGINMTLDDDGTVATSILQSPGAFCVTGTPLYPGQSIFLRCHPTMDDGHTASNFRVKLWISNQSPEKLSERSGGFSLTDICISKPPLTAVQTLHKDECRGEVRVSVLTDNRLEYRTANNKVNSQTLWYDATEGVWVYLELYRLQITISSNKTELGRQCSDPNKSLRSEPMTFPRQRSYSARSNTSSYQYTHVSCGSRGRTLPFFKPPEMGEDSGSYIDMGPLHHSNSCPADLDQSGGDEVDGIRHSLEDLNTNVKTLNNQMDALTNVFVAGGVGSGTCIRDTGAAISEKLVELRLGIRRNWIELINCLQTETMGDLLFQHGVISHAELDKIRRRLQIDGQEANRQILDILIRRGIKQTILNEILEKAGDAHLKGLFFKQ